MKNKLTTMNCYKMEHVTTKYTFNQYFSLGLQNLFIHPVPAYCYATILIAHEYANMEQRFRTPYHFHAKICSKTEITYH